MFLARHAHILFVFSFIHTLHYATPPPTESYGQKEKKFCIFDFSTLVNIQYKHPHFLFVDTMSTSIADAFKKLNVSPESSTSEHEKIFNVSYEYLSKVKKFNDLKASKIVLWH